MSIDIFIIGGGIHGTGIAAEAASRGLKVMLCDKADLASGASSRTTSLISGGIHSLAKLELDVVRRSFHEQASLARRAPHLLRHVDFAIPIDPDTRSKTRLRASLFLYNSLRPSECKNETAFDTDNSPLKPHFRDCLTYSDCMINDSRLVISNALLARQYGAVIRPYTRVSHAERNNSDNSWRIRLADGEIITSRALVNTTGKDTNKLLQNALPSSTRCKAQLLRGDHIILPKLYPQQQGYTLQMEDKQLLYALPFRQHYTLIGSHEQVLEDDTQADDNKLTENAIEHLLGAVNHYFSEPVNRKDIVRHFWAVRSAYDDIGNTAARISYDVVLDLEAPDNHAPLINLFGGRLTTFRHSSEKAVELLKPYLGCEKNREFAQQPLPGGDIIDANLDKFIEELTFNYPWLDASYLPRYARVYGTLCHEFLNDCRSLEDLGEHFGNDLHAREIDYLIEQEWATCADDILWRRTRQGLSLDSAQHQRIDDYVKQKITQQKTA